MTTKIDTTPAMRRWNTAISWFDMTTMGRYDNACPDAIRAWLRENDCDTMAKHLTTAGRALGYFQHDPFVKALERFVQEADEMGKGWTVLGNTKP